MTFDLYFAGTHSLETEDYLFNHNANRLFSYADKPQKKLVKYDKEDCGKVFMDSGAYSVHHSNKVITLDDYIDFINETPMVTVFACLDVIPYPVLNHETSTASAKKSWENYIYMLERVKPEYRQKIVPTFHFGEPIEALKQMLEGYEGHVPEYIAFGGRAGIHTKYLYPALDTFFDVIKKSDNPNVKVHGFGITVLKLLESYPFTSADSTAWLQTAVTGGIISQNLRRTIRVSEQAKKDPTSFYCKDKAIQELLLKEFEEYGYTLEELAESHHKRLQYNIDYFLRWQKDYKYQPRSTVTKKKLF